MSELRHPERLYSVHPELCAFMKLVVATSPYDWCIVTGIRSLAGVQEKYAVGRTTPGPHAGEPGYPPLGQVLTNVSSLEHAPHAERRTPAGVYGCAVDAQFFYEGRLSAGETTAEQSIYRWYGHLAESQGHVWGGRFGNVDQAHVELRLWRSYPLPNAGNVA
jgi:hypothetical protein